jgi:dihydrofolate synthase/folylpolyglutamate synthase
VNCDLVEQPVSVAEPPAADPYAAALEFLYSRINYERTPPDPFSSGAFKLDRMRELLRLLGNPQLRLPAVHVAGTKGKGSTCAMIAAMLQSSGRRVGLFTSPHLHRFEERMVVNGVAPPAARVVELVSEAREICEELSLRGPEWSPTFFEVTTAMAWRFFEQEGAEIAVLEVGLGGRLDATNVCSPLVTLITSISLDHTQLLGDTVGQIAREKAGIVKPGVPVLSGAWQPEARAAIIAAAAAAAAPLVELGAGIRCFDIAPAAAEQAVPQHWRFSVETPWRTHRELSAPLRGRHQVDNAALAVAAVDALQATGFDVDPRWIAGLSAVNWPLRIEVLHRNPTVIVDAAHNEASIAALIETLRSVSARRRTLVFGTSRDKDAAAMLRRVAGEFDEVILTQYLSNPRALPVDELAGIAESLRLEHCRMEPTPKAAWQAALDGRHAEDLVCVTGSFFLAAEVREMILAAE